MLIRLAWRNLWRHRLRSSIMLAAMVFGISATVLMAGFMQSMIDNMIENAISLQLGHIQIHNRDFTLNPELDKPISNPDRWRKILEQDPHVTAFSLHTLVEGMINSAASNQGVLISGIIPDEEAQVTQIKDKLIAGDYLPEIRNPILIGEGLINKLNLRLNSRVVLSFSDIHGELTGAAFRIAGIFRTPSSRFDEHQVFVRYADLIRYTGVDSIHEIAIRVNDSRQFPTLLQALKQQASPGDLVRDWGEVQPLLAVASSNAKYTNGLMLLVIMVALGFGITNVMLMVSFERSQEFAVMVAIGLGSRQLVTLILLESMFLGLIGGIGGMITGVILLSVVANTGIPLDMVSDALAQWGVSSTLYPRIDFQLLIQVFGLVLLTAVLAGLYPARHLLKQPLAQALAAR